MKIALTTCYFPPRTGGVEKYCHHLATDLSKEHEITVFTSEENTVSGPFNTVHIPYRTIGKYQIPLFKETKKLLKKHRPDLIHLNGPLPYSTIIGFIAKQLKIPSVLTYHGDVNPTNPIIKIGAWVDRNLYRFLFKKLIVTSPKYKKRASKFFPKKYIKSISLGIETAFFTQLKKEYCVKNLGLNEEKKHILFVGKLDQNQYYKGVDTLIETSKLLPQHNFLIVGDGDMRDHYESLAKGQKNITFKGKVNDEALKKYYHAGDLLVLPSNSSSEGFGIVLLEAAACGTPVITTSVAGSSEFVAKEHFGHIIPPENPQALARAIEASLQPETYSTLRKNCHRATQHLTWQNTAEKTNSLYQSLINNEG